MRMGFIVKYMEVSGEVFFEEHYETFVFDESEGKEWINSQNLKYSDRVFVIEAFTKNPILEICKEILQ